SNVGCVSDVGGASDQGPQETLRLRHFVRTTRSPGSWSDGGAAGHEEPIDGDNDHGTDDRDHDALDVDAGHVGDLQDGPREEASDDGSDDAQDDRLYDAVLTAPH